MNNTWLTILRDGSSLLSQSSIMPSADFVSPASAISATSSTTTLASANTDSSLQMHGIHNHKLATRRAMSLNRSPVRDMARSVPSSGTPGVPFPAAGTTPTQRRHTDNVPGTAPPLASSVSSSYHVSPILSPDASTVGNSSSVFPSPEPLRGRELESAGISSFQLPDSILSHKISVSSLHQHVPTSRTQPGGAMHEAVKNTNLIRRLSNKASKAITRRRPSSAHPNSRDVSVGPGILRRRSDSNNTAPAGDIIERLTFDTESEYENDERDDAESISMCTFDNIGITDSALTTNAASSVNGSLAPSAVDGQVGPVIPLALLHGVPIRKVSKKNNSKRLTLILDVEAGKITWDKIRPSKSIYIDDIKEIRIAEDIRQYRLDCGISEAEESRFFSILYTVPDTTQTKLMHLIAETEENFRDWTSTLDAIYKDRQNNMASLMSFNDKAVRAYWEREMAKQSAEKLAAATAFEYGLVDFLGVERICRNLHIHVSQETLRAKFAEVDFAHSGFLNYAGFQDFVRSMRKREDILALHRTIASDATQGITRDEFLDFLRNTQGENVDDDLASWDSVFARYTRRLKSSKDSSSASSSGSDSRSFDETPRMSEAGLASFLASPWSSPLVEEPRGYEFDRPMNEYYISSSHNTYLMGRQIAGTSSVEGYISALNRGCRCVEIDCWDGQDGQPIVVHGKTWTSSISFREAINGINRYAFAKSPFPLWISLEVHCNPEQQRIMAKIMREVFGSKLVTEPLPSATNRLPSPSELKYRVLIKTKKTQQPAPLSQQPAPEGVANKGVAGELYGRRRGNSLPTPFQKSLSVSADGTVSAISSPTSQLSQPSPLSLSDQSSPVLSPSFVNVSPRKSSTSKARVNTINEGEVPRDVSRDAPSVSGGSDCDSSSEKSGAKPKQSKIVPELGCLAVYCVGVHKTTSFEDGDCKLYNHILSWDETVYDKNTKTQDLRRAVYWHNMRYMMRVYPKPYRIGSSNFNPLAHWRRGVQMAALNWQTYDLGMQLNTAMFFGGTDQSGYVLKPRECREFQVLPNLPGESKPRELKRERKNVNFSIGVVSAQQLMRPVTFPERRTLDPYVEVEVFLADDKRHRDERREEGEHFSATPLLYRTKIVPENGFNPVFDQKFNFNFTTKYPDLVFVRMSVKLAENGKYSSGSPTASFTAKLSNLKQGYRNIPLVDMNADRYMFSKLLCEIRKEPITSIFVPDAPESTTKFKSIRTVFNRSTNMSPKSSMDSGLS